MWDGSPSALDLPSWHPRLSVTCAFICRASWAFGWARRLTVPGVSWGSVAGLGGRRSRVLGAPSAHVLPPCQLASWPPGAGLSFAQLKPLWPVAACSTPSAAEVVAMPLLLAAPSGWGRGGRVVAAPVEFHLSGDVTFC